MASAAKSKADRYLAVLILLAIIYVSYWTLYANYKYSDYLTGYFDSGINLNSAYDHILYPATLPGLQYLVFGNHMSMFSLFLEGILYVFRNPLTLYALQYIAIALAAIVAYFVGRDFVGKRSVGFAIAFCLLISAGTRGITVYDFHLEAFIPLFYIMAFYFYVRNKRAYFLASLALLVSVMETAPFMAMTLLIGLLFYELVHTGNASGTLRLQRWERLKSLGAGAMIAIVSALLYIYAIHSLLLSYQVSAYAVVPPPQKVIDFFSPYVAALANPGGVNYSVGQLIYAIMYGVAVLILGFGLLTLADPVLTALLISPFLLQVLVIHNTGFASLGNEYYAYVLGGAVAAAALGFKIFQEKAWYFKRYIDSIVKSKDLTYISFSTMGLAFVVSAFLFAAVYADSLGIFAFAPPNSTNFTALSAALNAVPSNSTVMAQSLVTPHLYYVKYLELPPNSQVVRFTTNGIAASNATLLYWTKPDYIVVDTSLPDYDQMVNSNFSVYLYMGDNYTPIASAGNLTVYKEK